MAELYIGLMAGTSLDGIDAALVELGQGKTRLLHACCEPMDQDLRAQLEALTRPGSDEVDRMGLAANAFARAEARTIARLLSEAEVDARRIVAIGSHGQTIRHRPSGPEPYTIQLGNPALLAELTGISVVADFRRRDLAAGGQGAPLVPAFHAALFLHPKHTRAVVNIGGIANLTLIPAEDPESTSGYDTGPGNLLMDGWTLRHTGEPFDRDGAFAAQGERHEGLLQALLNEPYFHRAPPKSSGRELFNPGWLDSHLSQFGRLRPEDVQATLLALTVETIARAVEQARPAPDELWLCGGGALNSELLDALGHRLAPMPVATTAELGLDPEWVEAVAFAWLAWRFVCGEPGNLPAVTGARGRRVLGALYPA